MTREHLHLYEVRPRKDKRGVDLISDALPFGRLCVAMRVHNRDRSLLGIDGGAPARTPTGRTEVVSDDFSILV